VISHDRTQEIKLDKESELSQSGIAIPAIDFLAFLKSLQESPPRLCRGNVDQRECFDEKESSVSHWKGL
jgi:hypothetical protein